MQTLVSVFGLKLPVAPGRVEYAHDRTGRVVAVRPPGSEEWLRYDRAPDGSLTIRSESGRVYVQAQDGVARLGNGTAERLTTDLVGRPARIEVFGREGVPILDLAYGYDDQGRIERLGPHRIAYRDDRVASVDEIALEHDERGNLVAAGDSKLALRGVRVVAARGALFEYDEEGNRVARLDAAGRTEYRYGDGGRLVEVELDGEPVVSYAYDGRGRRVRREDAHGVIHRHYDAEGNLLAETDEEGRALATFVRDGRRCLARIDGAVGAPAAEWDHLDHAGTAWAVTDDSGRVVARRAHPLEPGPGPYMGRFRDDVTGFHDFGARDYDAETGCFVTPDSYTFDDRDPRLARTAEPKPALRHWAAQPRLHNRYAFCLGDPVNNVDLDGHSAWWFFLTIPSSLIWAIPNTIVALTIILVNLYMEVVGWIVWPFMMIAHKDTGVKYYPWGYGAQNPTPPAQPTNPFSPDMRNHFWLWLDASTDIGVPWALINGSFCSVGRAFTMGNVIFFDMVSNFGEDGDKNQRYVVPKDPDTQLTLLRSTRHHEMQHTFQYSWLGPLFHCLPLGMVPRLITNAAKAQGRPLNKREEWWTKFDLAGLVTLVDGLLLFPLTFGKVKFKDIETWFNPAHWWQHLFPGRWTDILTAAINMDNWMPGIGIYTLDMMFRGGQSFSWFERNSGAWSGNTYGTVVEAEKDEIYVGEFTRVIGADVPQAPNSTNTWAITWAVSPAAPLPAGSPGSTGTSFDATQNFINLDKNNVLPVKVTNGKGIYFHSTAPGKYKVTGSGASGAGRTSEDVEITVKDIGVVVQTNVFVCQSQVLAISGDGNAAYSIRFQNGLSGSGGSISGLGYTAGSAAGTDVIEVVATYAANSGVFKTYGDTAAGVAPFAWVVKTITITVKEPTITPSATEVFVGGSVVFTFDLAPQTSAATALVPGSHYEQASRTFTAGRGAIDTERVETLTFGFGCRDFPVTIRVKPIVATATPVSVAAGGTAQVNVSGGTGPYTFEVVAAGSSGPSVSASGAYHAGTTAGPVTDVVTVTDANGGRGTVSIAVTP